MIVVTVQGKYNGLHDTVLNGKKITGEEQKIAINNLLSKIPPKEIIGDNIYSLNDKEIFCSMLHPERDVEGRSRIVYIVWDKEASEEMIKKSVETIGLNYDSFLKLKNTFDKKKTQKLMLIALIVVVLAIAILILKDEIIMLFCVPSE